MSRLIPNSRTAGPDSCTDPVELVVPTIIVNNDGGDCFWYHNALDGSSADLLAFAMLLGLSSVEAYRIDLRLILPAACDVRAAVDELDDIQSDPVRIVLRVD